MKIIFGADHAGFEVKKALLRHFEGKKEIECVDLGNYEFDDRDDYPIFAEKVALEVAKNDNTVGVLICGTGIGMAIAANKIPGISAAPCWDERIAHFAAAHNKINVITLPGRRLNKKPIEAINIVETWLNTQFAGDLPKGERHKKRIEMVKAIDQKYRRPFP
jgi:ribose 5-phosphate isomerase B